MKKEDNNLPLVVIFGRTNVGKSTLFNTLIGKKRALTSDIPGTTRDSNIGTVEWRNKIFKLIDTGGIMDLNLLTNKKEKGGKKIALTVEDIDIKVQKQARDYLVRASLILFMVDARDGLLPTDRQMALQIKKILPETSQFLLVANKVDSMTQRKEIAEFNKLALGEPFPVSAATGSGTGDLLDLILKKIKFNKSKKITKKTEPEDMEKINVGIFGKPNVGKSSLINAILGEDKIIVSPVPHTTREPQDTEIEYRGKIINLIDTAGISKTGQKSVKHKHVKRSLQKFSIHESLKVLDKTDIALLVIDINEGITHQEAKLVQAIVEKRAGLIIVANKWDLIKERDTKLFTEKIYSFLPFARWAPIQFVSAHTGEKVNKVLDLINEVAEHRKTTISENALTKFLGKIVKWHKPPKDKGIKQPRIYELNQVNSNPPRFTVRIGSRDTLHNSYIHFIENRLREKFGFWGNPIVIYITRNRQVHGAHDPKFDLEKTDDAIEDRSEEK